MLVGYTFHRFCTASVKSGRSALRRQKNIFPGDGKSAL
jgi:hypothetical protein